MTQVRPTWGRGYLELQGALGALCDVLVEALLGIVGQLKGDLGGAARARQQQQQPPQQRKQSASPTARCCRPAWQRRRPRHHSGSAAASTELRGLDARSRPGPRRPASLSDACDGERARASEETRRGNRRRSGKTRGTRGTTGRLVE